MDQKYASLKMEEDIRSSSETLSVDESDTLLEKQILSRYRRAHQSWRQLLLVHLSYILVYSFLAVLLAHLFSRRYHGPDLIFSPLREVVTYEVHGAMSDYDNSSPYLGEPTPELDQAWFDLVQYTPILLTEQEFSHYHKDGLLLADGSGYLSTISMYHDLHCIRYLHQTLWSDHYFPNQTEGERVERRDHSEHCLKSLKHGVMCHGDVTVRTMVWEDDKPLPVATDNPHECVNFEKIDEWMKSRSVEAWKPGLLIHPKLGPSFPNGLSRRWNVASGDESL